VSYNELVDRPQQQAERVSQFLAGSTNAESMARAVDRSLYRNRKIQGDRINDPETGNSN
jgi:hypothetical protein